MLDTTTTAQDERTITLEVVAGPHEGKRFQFARPERFLVGRAADTNLQLIEDAHFSRHHFVLEVNPPACFLRDLGSSNGTFVNGQKVKECSLCDGDVISGGRTRMRIGLSGLSVPPSLIPSGQAEPESLGDLPTLTAGPVLPRRDASGTSLRVPGYDLETLLGQGGMGAVYLARRQATGQRCALKVILPESATDERAMKRFLREVKVLSQLEHPRIVRFQEMGIFAPNWRARAKPDEARWPVR
jgi:hypothetical protein